MKKLLKSALVLLVEACGKTRRKIPYICQLVQCDRMNELHVQTPMLYMVKLQSEDL